MDTALRILLFLTSCSICTFLFFKRATTGKLAGNKRSTYSPPPWLWALIVIDCLILVRWTSIRD